MNIQAEKIELLKMLLETENPKIIESIKKIFKKEKASDFGMTYLFKNVMKLKKLQPK